MSALSLIPFVVGLVGYDSCVKTSPELWKYGPEYYFKVECNASLTNTAFNEISISNVTIDLVCRPFFSTLDVTFGSDSLQCTIPNATVQNYNWDIKKKKLKIIPLDPNDDTPQPFEIGNQTFEIIYNKNGIKDIKIELPVSPWRMNIYRIVSSFLDYGYDNVDKTKTSFNDTKFEKSTLGECQTNFSITKFPNYEFTGVKWTSKCDKLKLETLAYKDTYPVVEFHKVRNLNNCTKRTPYFFGGDEDTKNKPPRYSTNNTVSYATYVAAPLSFECTTINHGFATFDNKKVPVNELTSICLVKIQPATKEFKRIDAPGTTEIHAHSEIITPKV